MSDRRRSRGWFILRILISAGALIWLVRTIEWSEVAVLWRRLDAGWLVVGLALNALLRFISALKWRLLLAQKGLSVPYGYLLRIVWISNVLGHVLPAGIGGDNFRMLAMARGSSRAPEIVSTVVMERLTGVMALAALAVLGGLWFYGKWDQSDVALALTAPLGLLFLVLALLWTGPGYRLVHGIFSRIRRLPGQAFLAKVHEETRAYRRHPKVLAVLFILSMASQLDRVLGVFVVAMAMQLHLSLGGAFVLVPTALFISMLPISISGWGVQEVAFVLLLRLAGINTSAAFGLSLLSRMVVLAADLPGLVMFVRHGLRREAGGSSVDAETKLPVESHASSPVR